MDTNEMQVISMTEGKIRRDHIFGRDIIVKKSSFDEIKNIEAARNLFKKHEIRLDEAVFHFHLPKIYDYQNGNIFMEFLQGENIEIALRTPDQRGKAVRIVNQLFQYLHDHQIYWGDFAPRNIIIDKEKQIVNLCDFERGIQQNVTSIEYLQNYAYEEYAAFLLPTEREFTKKINQIFSVDEIRHIDFEDIKSKRVRSIIQEQGLPLDVLSNQTVVNVNKMIVLAETPYKQNGQMFFPIIELEKIKDKSYADFAKKVCHIIRGKGREHGNSGRI